VTEDLIALRPSESPTGQIQLNGKSERDNMSDATSVTDAWFVWLMIVSNYFQKLANRDLTVEFNQICSPVSGPA
jgi:hypothetical protein